MSFPSSIFKGKFFKKFLKKKTCNNKNKGCKNSESDCSDSECDSKSECESECSESDDKCNSFDYLIIGFGTAASVLARELSDPNKKGKFKRSVAVFEAGANQSNDPIVQAGVANPAIGSYYNILQFSPKYAFNSVSYDTNGDFSNPFNNPGVFPSEIFSCGRMWFGSSAHNFMAAVRGSSDYWDNLVSVTGNIEWSYSNMLPRFKAIEAFNINPNNQSQTPNDRGTNGVLPINQVSGAVSTDPATIAIANAFTNATGAPNFTTGTIDYNVPSGDLSVAMGQAFCSADGSIRSFGKNFLPETILSPNGKGLNNRKLTVYSGAFVTKVIFDKKMKAIGIEYIINGKSTTAYANKKIILCAGAPFSAAILQRSGIGDPAILTPLEIKVKIANPLVGINLKEHYGCQFVMSGIGGPSGSFPAAQFVAFTGQNSSDIRKYQFVINGVIAAQYAGAFYAQQLGLLDALPQSNFNVATNTIAGWAWYLRPQSNGTAHIISKDPLANPNIQFNFFTDAAGNDMAETVNMFKILAQVAADSGVNAQMIYPPPDHYPAPYGTAPDDSLLMQDAWAGIAQFSPDTVTNHYTSTCQMGTSISNGVVSGTDLHVFGTQNLMVADNSIYPSPETGNTAYQAYLAGKMAARIILKKI